MPDTTSGSRGFAKLDQMRSPTRTPVRPEVQATEMGRAWRRYLRATRAAEPDEYELEEERAWGRLAGTLEALGVPLRSPEEPADR